LFLGESRFTDAIAELEAVGQLPLACLTRDQAIVPWAFDLIEAYAGAAAQATTKAKAKAKARALARATELLETFDVNALEVRGSESESPYLMALGLRCQGLVGPSQLRAAAFTRALEIHADLGMPFEQARTLLALGEHLRTNRKNLAARKPLGDALAIFEQLEAEHWARRTRDELDKAGAPAARRTGVAAKLTGQELQVALLVAGGATNKQAADKLFLGEATIVFHLGNVYSKLGTTRGELAALFAQPERPSPDSE
jgi:DNA-binding CsgD family transcriptional regulator